MVNSSMNTRGISACQSSRRTAAYLNFTMLFAGHGLTVCIKEHFRYDIINFFFRSEPKVEFEGNQGLFWNRLIFSRKVSILQKDPLVRWTDLFRQSTNLASLDLLSSWLLSVIFCFWIRLILDLSSNTWALIWLRPRNTADSLTENPLKLVRYISFELKDFSSTADFSLYSSLKFYHF